MIYFLPLEGCLSNQIWETKIIFIELNLTDCPSKEGGPEGGPDFTGGPDVVWSGSDMGPLGGGGPDGAPSGGASFRKELNSTWLNWFRFELSPNPPLNKLAADAFAGSKESISVIQITLNNRYLDLVFT